MSTVAPEVRSPRPRHGARGTGRLAVFLWSSLYFALLAHVYIDHLGRWDYLGFWYVGTDAWRLGTTYVLAMLPLLLLSTRVERFSTFIHWIIYFFVYVPAVLIPVLQGLTDDVMTLAFTIFVSFLVIVGFPRLPALQHRRRFSRRTFWLAFTSVYAVLLAYALFVFRDHLSLANLYDVYGQRSIASDVATGTLVGYATGILSGSLNSFLLAIGLVQRRKAMFALGALGQVVVYATFALKAVVFSVAVMVLFYFVLFRPGRVAIWKLGAIVCATIVLPLLLLWAVEVENSPLLEYIAAMVFMRTYGMVGSLTGLYYEFFSFNPLTYFSHINVVGLFVEYPYDLSPGEVVGRHLNSDMNANANFFATDGVASAGLVGVLLTGLIAGAIFRAIDSLLARPAWRLLCIASPAVAMSLANTSVFTTLLTGGLIFLIVVCHFWVQSTTQRP